MNDHLTRALAAVLHDLDSAGGPVPRVEPSRWQDGPTAESAYLWSSNGTGMGVWVDTAQSPAKQLAMVAEQVQEWAIEEMPGLGRPTNWPRCDEHPSNHPLEPVAKRDVAIWRCPRSKRPACEIGRLSGSKHVSMSVLAVDERDCEWERHLSRYRVYLQDGSTVDGREWTGGSTATYDVTGADVLQVIDWAQRQAGDGATYAVALVSDADDRRGLIWLVGADGNDVTEPGTPESVAQGRMIARRSQPVGIPPADRASR